MRSIGKHATVAYTAGDLGATLAVGVATALSAHVIIGPSWHVALAMIAGMVLGMAIHLVIGVVLLPVLGGIEAMIAPGLTGMYGGMYFAMHEAMRMEHGSMLEAVRAGALLAACMFAGVWLYNRAVRGEVFSGEEHQDGR